MTSPPLDQRTRDFDRRMREIYEEAAKLGYPATYFLRMLNESDGVKAAKQLLASGDRAQSGLARLWELKRLDLSVEAVVLEFPDLFFEHERAVAIKRLQDYEYPPAK